MSSSPRPRPQRKSSFTSSRTCQTKKALSRRTVGNEALNHATSFASQSSFYSAERERSVRKLLPTDIVRGKLIGKGSFNYVYQASMKPEPSSSIGDNSARNDNGSPPDEGAAVGEPGEEYMYAVKCIKPSCLDDPRRYRDGVIDLVVEAKILSSIGDHENIIKVHGVAVGCVSALVAEGKYFIVLERVECTLSDRLSEWRSEHRGRIPLPSVFGTGRKKAIEFKLSSDSAVNDFTAQRLDIAYGISRGIQYLHEHKILYRDMKPENIGLTKQGCVKILDFGFAKEIYPGKSVKRPTGMVGTLRYMAPEVALCKDYGLSADVYSFAFVLWETCSLKKPFKKLNRRQIESKVVCGKMRPTLRESWPASVRVLMKMCWADDPSERPRMEEVVVMIADCIQENKRRRQRATSRTSFLDKLSRSSLRSSGHFRSNHESSGWDK